MSMFIRDSGLCFFFLVLVMSISDFGFRLILASYNEFGSVPCCSNFVPCCSNF